MIKEKVLKLSKKWRTYDQVIEAIQPITSNSQSIERAIRLMVNYGSLESRYVIVKFENGKKKFKQFRRRK